MYVNTFHSTSFSYILCWVLVLVIYYVDWFVGTGENCKISFYESGNIIPLSCMFKLSSRYSIYIKTLKFFFKLVLLKSFVFWKCVCYSSQTNQIDWNIEKINAQWKLPICHAKESTDWPTVKLTNPFKILLLNIIFTIIFYS